MASRRSHRRASASRSARTRWSSASTSPCATSGSAWPPRPSVAARDSWPPTAIPSIPGADALKAGAGSIVAALATAAGREPDLVVGKPGPTLFQAAADAAGVPVESAVVIGDGLQTDIRAAQAVGARSVLMLTGVTTREHLDDADPDAQPDGRRA